MYSHVTRSETRSLIGLRKFCVTAKLHLTAREMELLERYRLDRIEIFYDPFRDELKARGIEVTDVPNGAKWKRI